MIRNVIFDFGQVLIRFDGKEITEQAIPNKEEAARVADVFFDRAYWDKIDTGELTGETLIEAAKTRLPEKYIRKGIKVSPCCLVTPNRRRISFLCMSNRRTR